MDAGSHNEALALLDRIPVRTLWHRRQVRSIPDADARCALCRCLFHAAVDQVFHALIVTQNASVITPDGTVDEDQRKALMDTIKTYATWGKHMDRAPRASAQK
jgi:hypothetical protein